MSAFQRKFINEVRRCEEMERKLRFLRSQLEKAGIEIRPAGNVEAPDPQNMIDLEVRSVKGNGCNLVGWEGLVFEGVLVWEEQQV